MKNEIDKIGSVLESHYLIDFFTKRQFGKQMIGYFNAQSIIGHLKEQGAERESAHMGCYRTIDVHDISTLPHEW